MPLEPIPSEKILAVIGKVGPVQPLDVRRELGLGDTMLIGAILSQLVAEKHVAISRTKRGGSPFYYDPRRPETIERLSEFLQQKDRQTCEFLREQGVVREDALDPLTRVGMQNIPDFSRRFTLMHDGAEVAHWRYYLVDEQEARARAAAELAPAAESPAPPPAPAQAPAAAAQEASKAASPATVPSPASAPAPEVQTSLDARTAPAPTPAPAPKAKRARRKPKAQATASQSAASAPEASPPDELVKSVERFAAQEKGTLSAMQVLKQDVELTCTLTVDGPYGPLALFVYACAKKPTDKPLMRALLSSRGQGMPLLVLSAEAAGKRTALDDIENVSFRRLP